jgi:hypothetical protein
MYALCTMHILQIQSWIWSVVYILDVRTVWHVLSPSLHTVYTIKPCIQAPCVWKRCLWSMIKFGPKIWSTVQKSTIWNAMSSSHQWSIVKIWTQNPVNGQKIDHWDFSHPNTRPCYRHTPSWITSNQGKGPQSPRNLFTCDNKSPTHV